MPNDPRTAATRHLTIPQARAIDWLPADGHMVALPGTIAPAVGSLERYCPDLVVTGEVRGPRGGVKRGAALTDAGRQERAARNAARLVFLRTLRRCDHRLLRLMTPVDREQAAAAERDGEVCIFKQGVDLTEIGRRRLAENA